MSFTFFKFTKEQIDSNNAVFRKNATPAQRKMMDEVDEAIASENENMDTQFEAESELRQWAQQVTGRNMNISEIQTLAGLVKSTPPGGLFEFKPKTGDREIYVKTQGGSVLKARNYIFSLEKIVIETSKRNAEFTKLSFFDLIKIAVRRIFNRSQSE